MAKRITVCAGIDTGKHKLDVAIDGRSEQLQVQNTPEGHQTADVLLGLSAQRFFGAVARREFG